MKPLVSILIPAYNAEKWIGDTIRSALAQTWPQKEVIIVDDGSNDQTRAIALKFAGAGIKVITQYNHGAAVARNTAFKACKGDYIQWLDADDLLAPDKIEKQMVARQRCQSTRTLLSSAFGTFLFRPARATFSPTPLWCDLSPIEWMLRNLERKYWMQTAAWIVSRELTETVGPWDSRLLGDDDGEYFFRVVRASDAVSFVPESKVFYRKPGPGNLSYVGLSPKKLEAQWLSMQLHVSHIRSLEDSPRVRSACLKYLQDYMICFYPEMSSIVEQAEQLAAALGGRLVKPQFSWKYVWIQRLFGWSAAKRSQVAYNFLKGSLRRSRDNTLFRLGL